MVIVNFLIFILKIDLKILTRTITRLLQKIKIKIIIQLTDRRNFPDQVYEDFCPRCAILSDPKMLMSHGSGSHILFHNHQPSQESDADDTDAD